MQLQVLDKIEVSSPVRPIGVLILRMPDERTKATRPESLDDIVRHSPEQIQTAASWDASEMELQIAAAGALKDFARRAQIKLEGRHNVTIATGRPDSLYGGVIVEYKKPGTLSSTKHAANNDALITQLKAALL